MKLIQPSAVGTRDAARYLCDEANRAGVSKPWYLPGLSYLSPNLSGSSWSATDFSNRARQDSYKYLRAMMELNDSGITSDSIGWPSTPIPSRADEFLRPLYVGHPLGHQRGAISRFLTWTKQRPYHSAWVLDYAREMGRRYAGVSAGNDAWDTAIAAGVAPGDASAAANIATVTAAAEGGEQAMTRVEGHAWDWLTSGTSAGRESAANITRERIGALDRSPIGIVANIGSTIKDALSSPYLKWGIVVVGGLFVLNAIKPRR